MDGLACGEQLSARWVQCFLGGMMTECPVAVSDVSDNRCNGLVSLEV